MGNRLKRFIKREGYWFALEEEPIGPTPAVEPENVELPWENVSEYSDREEDVQDAGETWIRLGKPLSQKEKFDYVVIEDEGERVRISRILTEEEKSKYVRVEEEEED
jgi:hypothetical protein